MTIQQWEYSIRKIPLIKDGNINYIWQWREHGQKFARPYDKRFGMNTGPPYLCCTISIVQCMRNVFSVLYAHTLFSRDHYFFLDSPLLKRNTHKFVAPCDSTWLRRSLLGVWYVIGSQHNMLSPAHGYLEVNNNQKRLKLRYVYFFIAGEPAAPQ